MRNRTDLTLAHEGVTALLEVQIGKEGLSYVVF
jgi:hypothetical protein